jgi:hypothetical protein
VDHGKVEVNHREQKTKLTKLPEAKKRGFKETLAPCYRAASCHEMARAALWLPGFY